jgi:membrane peptidoglycan carboxypeptidase
MFGIAWAMTPIPDGTQPDATAQKSLIYYRDGKTVLATQGVDRTNVSLARVPKYVRDAVIAAENRTFYQDQGVSIKGTVRAMWSTVTGRQIQGGSTITQQMVRNYYSGLSQERSVVRKLKEIMISLKVDQSKSKDWVLERYLNTIYFGRGAYGVQTAAQAYFGRNVGQLNIAQGAYLAAVIQQPTRFADPKGADLEAVRGRWQTVIDGMVQTKALTRQQAAAQRFPALKEPTAALSLTGQKGYMLAQVRAELNRRGYSDEKINQGGLRIVTTFDKSLMAAARDAVDSVLPQNTPKKVRTGLAAVDPSTGEVLAFYGGKGYQYDNAFSAKVQAGSTFKPYALAAALENGYSLDTRVNGNSPMRVASASIPNSGGHSYGSSIDLVTATRNSVNTAFVDLGQKIGVNKVAEAAESAGIPKAQLAPHLGAATLPLGVASVSAVQQASGFGTFAADGVHHDAHVIRSITDGSGATEKITTPGTRAFSTGTAADTTFALTQVVEGGTGTGARLSDRPVAGKTGTADESTAIWFSGYTPQLSAAVNMFRDDNKPVRIPGYGELYGGSLPAQIWRAFMIQAMDGKPVKLFPEPTFYRSGYDHYGDFGNGGVVQDQPRSTGGPAAPGPGTTTAPPTADPGITPDPVPTDQPSTDTNGNGNGNGDTGGGNPPNPDPTLSIAPTGG